MIKNIKSEYVLCVDNKDCEDLEKRKIYQVLPDEDAKQEGYMRIIDESGEDYLYPESYFIPIQLPREAQDALCITAQSNCISPIGILGVFLSQPPHHFSPRSSILFIS